MQNPWQKYLWKYVEQFLKEQVSKTINPAYFKKHNEHIHLSNRTIL